MLIGLASLNQSWEDKYENLAACERIAQVSRVQGVDLLIFPEMTLTGFSNNISRIAEKNDSSPTVQSFKNLAKQNCVGIIFGVVFEESKKASNNAIFLDKTGQILGTYKKIHPFSLSGENKFYVSGNLLKIVEFDSFSIGLTICYDLRFPELYSSLGTQSELVVNIASWPSQRLDHWTTLLKARAIENQIFMVGVNRIGSDGNGQHYMKSSMIINPNGIKLEPLHSEDELDVFDLDISTLTDFKSRFSTTQDRKPEFYKSIL